MNIELEIPFGVLYELFEDCEPIDTEINKTAFFKREFRGIDVEGREFNFSKGDQVMNVMIDREGLGIVYSRYLQKGFDIERYNSDYPDRQVKNEDELMDAINNDNYDLLDGLSIPVKITATFDCWNISYL